MVAKKWNFYELEKKEIKITKKQKQNLKFKIHLIQDNTIKDLYKLCTVIPIAKNQAKNQKIKLNVLNLVKRKLVGRSLMYH